MESKKGLSYGISVILLIAGLALTIARIAEVTGSAWDGCSTCGYMICFALLTWFTCVSEKFPPVAFGVILSLRALFSAGTTSNSILQGAPAFFLCLNTLSVLSLLAAILFLSKNAKVVTAGLAVNLIVCIVRVLYVTVSNPLGFGYYRLVLPVLDVALIVVYLLRVAKLKA